MPGDAFTLLVPVVISISSVVAIVIAVVVMLPPHNHASIVIAVE